MADAPPTTKLIDAKAFWRTLGERATGMTIVTTDSDAGPAGFLGLSATHVTADPPTMLVSVDQKTSALQGILSRRHFAVNYLPASAGPVADAFSGKSGLLGAARFIEGEWGRLTTGAPVISRLSERSIAWSRMSSSAAASQSLLAKLSTPRSRPPTNL